MSNPIKNSTLSGTEIPLPNCTKLFRAPGVVTFTCVIEDGCELKDVSENISYYGYAPDDFLNGNLNYTSIIYEDDIDKVQIQIHQSLEQHLEEFSILHRIITKDAKIKWIDVRFLCNYDEDLIINVCGMFSDVTDMIDREIQVDLLSQALQQSDKMVFIADHHGIINYVNDSLVEHSGYSRSELIGARTNIFNSGEHDREFFGELWNTILSGESYNNIIINRKKNGEIYYIDINITPVKDKYSHTQNFVATCKDVTIQVQLEHKLENMALTDNLTQVYNRYKINAEIELHMARAKRSATPFSILMFDIDDFKKINDTYGHYVGDVVLKELTQLIAMNIREVDIFGRWGGEEFLLLLDNTTQDEAVRVAEKIRHIIEATIIAGHYHITVSIGVSEYKVSEQKTSLLQRVDRALYKAKTDGKNRVVFE